MVDQAMTVPDVIDALGGTKGLQELLGCNKQWVSQMRTGNFFPRKWHLTISRECERLGIDFDPEKPAPLPEEGAAA